MPAAKTKVPSHRQGISRRCDQNGSPDLTRAAFCSNCRSRATQSRDQDSGTAGGIRWEKKPFENRKLFRGCLSVVFGCAYFAL
jgi:hypothetical protein